VYDHPENNIVGPKEVDIEIDKILLEQDKPATTTKAKVYRLVSKPKMLYLYLIVRTGIIELAI
jgi:hypothetical protein